MRYGGSSQRPAAGTGLPTGADKARPLAGSIPAAWEETGRPCTERAVDHALACAARRGVAERVSTGLLLTRIGLQPVGRQMLAAADHIASREGPP